MKRLTVFFTTFFFAVAAQAQIVTSLPFTLTNGTVADATQVMANFNQIVNNTNSNAAHNGANSDITSILGLTTALDFTLGGGGEYVGTGGGSANAQTVSSLTPSTGFSYLKGKSVTWLATATNTAAATLNVNALGAKNIYQLTTTGQAALVGGEIQSGSLIRAVYDGTEFVLLNSNNVVRLDNLGSLQGGIAVPIPQGRLTFTSGVPVMTAGYGTSEANAAATIVYYTPYNGNLIPIYNGTYMQVLPFSELTLTLNNTNYSANNLYDVFVFLNSGVVTIGTGPAWTTIGTYYPGTGTTLTASGAAARSTALTRVNGLLVNTGGSMTARNNSTTYTVPTQQGTYVGTIWIDNTAGQITANFTYGQGRKFGVWNMYNRVPIMLKEGDSTANWTRNGAYRAMNNTAANSITLLMGYAEESYSVSYLQKSSETVGTTSAIPGIGINSATAVSGFSPTNGGSGGASLDRTNVMAFQPVALPLGLTSITALESSSGGGVTFYGTELNFLLTAFTRG